MVHPFSITIDPNILDDLRTRLAKTRWPDQVDNANWQAGTEETYLKEFCNYWQKEFDWQAQQDYLNRFAHFKATLDDTSIHFIHQKGLGKTSVPLLLIHGWLDSFVRFHKLIPLLSQADEHDFSFDVIIPSIPGYGFSDRPTEAAMNPKKLRPY